MTILCACPFDQNKITTQQSNTPIYYIHCTLHTHTATFVPLILLAREVFSYAKKLKRGEKDKLRIYGEPQDHEVQAFLS